MQASYCVDIRADCIPLQGLYHFRIKLPAEYPFRPPAIQMLTPNGRFELNSNVRSH